MESIKNFFKKVKVSSIVVGLLSLIIGIVCIVAPQTSASVICTVFGIVLIAIAISQFVDFCRLGGILGGNLLVMSIALALLGILCLTRADIITGILTILLGIYIIVDASSSLADAFVCARASVPSWWILLVTSLAMEILGVVVMFSDPATVMVFAGVTLIVEGIRQLVITATFSSKVKQAKETLKTQELDKDSYTIK